MCCCFGAESWGVLGAPSSWEARVKPSTNGQEFREALRGAKWAEWRNADASLHKGLSRGGCAWEHQAAGTQGTCFPPPIPVGSKFSFSPQIRRIVICMFFDVIYPHLPFKPNSWIRLICILYVAQSRTLTIVLYSFLRTINWPVRTFPSDLKCHFASMFDYFICWHVLCGSLFYFSEPQPLILTVSHLSAVFIEYVWIVDRKSSFIILLLQSFLGSHYPCIFPEELQKNFTKLQKCSVRTFILVVFFTSLRGKWHLFLMGPPTNHAI